MKFDLGRIKSSVGKGKKCWLPAFFPFTIMFSKAFYLRVVKYLDCVAKELSRRLKNCKTNLFKKCCRM